MSNSRGGGAVEGGAGAVAGSGAVATSHHLATEAGAEALRAGGNAVDAAIAAAAALCAVYPNNVALGGDLVALVRAPDGTVTFVNATGRAVRDETLEGLRERHGDRMPDRGIDTVTVPGGVRGWSLLAQGRARLGWDALLAPAARLADEHPLARSVAAAIVEDGDALLADPGCRAIFAPDGRGLREGEPLRQPALAATLRVLATHGPDAFYEGPLVEAWVAGLRRLGSRITAEEVAAFQPVLDAPISLVLADAVDGEHGTGLVAGLGARSLEIITSPPNTQGFSLLRTLRELDRLARRRRSEGGAELDPLGAGAGELGRLFAEGNAIRASVLADPDALSTGELLTRAGLRGRHRADDGGATGSETDTDTEAHARSAAPDADGLHPIRPARGDTVGLAAVSDDGWAVSLVQSAYWSFGAAVLEPETGVLFQNRGTGFSLDPAHPAAFAPGRRPPHTLMPVLVLDAADRSLVAVQSTMGGQAQPQIHAQLLLRQLGGASVGAGAGAGVGASAVTRAPRFAIGVQADGDTPLTATIESDLPDAAKRSLSAAGFALREVPPHDEDLGHANLIRPLPEGGAGYTDGPRWDAASDPRSDGSAIVVPPRP
ncbi:gamma-glutamyltransferase [Schumannella soli]|uniref:Gamma-glutamyltranspeptidase n=1 Tax=Schumannella soli TaxID=2590779 RepID=A0A506YAH9_9MICO|nr:gamma-glutamyltransferase [Schumannella soli]TPW78107.1 gamma-glutamyltranspeptidase [Schumannella soli]